MRTNTNEQFLYPTSSPMINAKPRHPSSFVTSDLNSNSLSPNKVSQEQDEKQPSQVLKDAEHVRTREKRCLSKEFFTCLTLSSIVIGLPIAIIIVLINLPRLSTRRDTRQQHYILLAFGFPFSLVVIVAVVYGIFSLVQRIRRGPDHSKHFRSRMSWRRFSRRLRGLSHHQSQHQSHSRRQYRTHCHQHPQEACQCRSASTISSHFHDKISSCSHHHVLDGGHCSDECPSCDSSRSAIDHEPKLYSLVTQVMSKQHKIANQSANSPRPICHVFQRSCDSSQSETNLNTKYEDLCASQLQSSYGHNTYERPLSTPQL